MLIYARLYNTMLSIRTHDLYKQRTVIRLYIFILYVLIHVMDRFFSCCWRYVYG